MKKLLLILTILLQVACSQPDRLEESNSQFSKKYKTQIRQIVNDREDFIVARSERRDVELHTSVPRNESLIRSMADRGYFEDKPNSLEYFRQKLQREIGEYIIDTPAFVRALKTYPEIQDVTYNFENDPKEYKRDITSFDNIKIPTYDYFGINSNLEEKQYDRVSTIELQENIDKIHNYFNPENRNLNVILLKEKEEIRKSRMAKLLLDDYQYKLEQKEAKVKDTKEDKNRE